jgi:hypothetical protein
MEFSLVGRRTALPAGADPLWYKGTARLDQFSLPLKRLCKRGSVHVPGSFCPKGSPASDATLLPVSSPLSPGIPGPPRIAPLAFRIKHFHERDAWPSNRPPEACPHAPMSFGSHNAHPRESNFGRLNTPIQNAVTRYRPWKHWSCVRELSGRTLAVPVAPAVRDLGADHRHSQEHGQFLAGGLPVDLRPPAAQGGQAGSQSLGRGLLCETPTDAHRSRLLRCTTYRRQATQRGNGELRPRLLNADIRERGAVADVVENRGSVISGLFNEPQPAWERRRRSRHGRG